MAKYPKGVNRKYIRGLSRPSTAIITRPKLRRAITDVNKLKKVARKVEIKEFIVSATT